MRAAQFALTILLALSLPALAEHDVYESPHGGPPEHGPKGFHGSAHQYDEHHDIKDHDSHPEYPHVDGREWIGHDTGRYDEHYMVKHAWAQGHFRGGFGPRHVWHLAGGGAGRFWINNWTWSVATYDAAFCGDWYWDRDSVSIYQDPDHAGWYLAYNLRLGTYVHVMFIGKPMV
jgi:hypothetical protein